MKECLFPLDTDLVSCSTRTKKIMQAQASIRMQRHSGLEGSTQRNLKHANTITIGFYPLVSKIIFIIGWRSPHLQKLPMNLKKWSATTLFS